ncbi:hypothetical protein DPMN_079754 [Dreissena polymorpha]|uniref:Uncharacterized protein n=1 Tax=Dreissena polymorpha TaxID=45954 RepID=A0A9D3YPK6_DREPO|nr:hypothetical protein DPMN_079754 [Dreissena polymorpha]
MPNAATLRWKENLIPSTQPMLRDRSVLVLRNRQQTYWPVTVAPFCLLLGSRSWKLHLRWMLHS